MTPARLRDDGESEAAAGPGTAHRLPGFFGGEPRVANNAARRASRGSSSVYLPRDAPTALAATRTLPRGVISSLGAAPTAPATAGTLQTGVLPSQGAGSGTSSSQAGGPLRNPSISCAVHGRLRRCCRAVGIEPRGRRRFLRSAMAPSTHPSDLWGWGSLPLANTWHHRALCLPLSECQQNAPQLCEAKSRSVKQLAHTFGGQISSQFFLNTTTNASLRLSQIVICRIKRQKNTCLKRPIFSCFPLRKK